MRKFQRLFFVSALLLVASAAAKDNPPTPPGELFAAGSAAYQKGQFAAALGYMGQYLDARAANVGDPRLAEAQAMFVTSATNVAKEEARSHFEAAAANFLMEQANHAAVGDGAAGMKAQAKKYLQDALAAAEKKSDHQRVTDLAEMWGRLFPDAPPALDKDKLDEHRLKALVQVSKLGRPDIALKLLRQIKSEGITDDAIVAAGINSTDLSIKYAQALYDRGWYRQAAQVCQNIAADAAPTAEQTSQANGLIERSLAMYFETCQKFGNAKMIEEASDLYSADTNSAREPSKAHRFQAAAAALKGTDAPLELTIPGRFAEGKGVWVGSDTGYSLGKDITIGGKGKPGNIQVGPGFVLTGGTITVSNGSLAFKGAPDKPIFLRNVQLHCEFTGSIFAENTIFVDCTFQKTGGWFWAGGWSSKWELSDCMLLQTHFAGLSQVDYGIRWNQDTFVDCDLPDRTLNQAPEKDAAGMYHSDWNKITNCTFFDCSLCPNVLWGGLPTTCYDCDIKGDSRYVSSKPLTVPVALAPGDTDFLSRLIIATSDGGAGMLQYTTGAPPASKPSQLWRLLPTSDAR